MSALDAAIDFGKSTPVVTSEFIGLGQTEKGQTSNRVANALCAHAADKNLNIPWLADYERVRRKASQFRPRRAATSRRFPDYLGLSLTGDWYVFEVKGRSLPFPNSHMHDWMDQATTIRSVNGIPVAGNIVSVAFTDGSEDDKKWKVQWELYNPLPNSVNLSVTELSYFKAYYEPFIVMNRVVEHIDIQGHAFFNVGIGGALVGLHNSIFEALKTRRSGRIKAFARDLQREGSQDIGDDITLFPDGIMVHVEK
jgi:hypothetical protein